MSNQVTTKDILSQSRDDLKEQINTESMKVLDNVFPALVENIQDVMARLPEDIFVSHFLPFFAGRIDINFKPTIIAEWVSVAGSPMSEVAITDHTGAILYIVPAIFDTSFINVNRQKQSMGFAAIVDKTNLMTNNLPVMGERFLNQALAGKLDEITNGPNSVAINHQRWIEIFSRYGIQPSVTSNETKSAIKTVNLEGDEIYD